SWRDKEEEKRHSVSEMTGHRGGRWPSFPSEATAQVTPRRVCEALRKKIEGHARIQICVKRRVTSVVQKQKGRGVRRVTAVTAVETIDTDCTGPRIPTLVACDCLVICLGAWSMPFISSAFGLDVKETERSRVAMGHSFEVLSFVEV